MCLKDVLVRVGCVLLWAVGSFGNAQKDGWNRRWTRMDADSERGWNWGWWVRLVAEGDGGTTDAHRYTRRECAHFVRGAGRAEVGMVPWVGERSEQEMHKKEVPVGLGGVRGK